MTPSLSQKLSPVDNIRKCKFSFLQGETNYSYGQTAGRAADGQEIMKSMASLEGLCLKMSSQDFSFFLKIVIFYLYLLNFVYIFFSLFTLQALCVYVMASSPECEGNWFSATLSFCWAFSWAFFSLFKCVSFLFILFYFITFHQNPVCFFNERCRDGSPDKMGGGEGLGGVEEKPNISGYMI